jgi:hypothetical protein
LERRVGVGEWIWRKECGDLILESVGDVNWSRRREC